MKQIHEFAVKWFDKFRDKKINYLELVDHYITDDCVALGFIMDCGHAFTEKYGDAASKEEILEPQNRAWFTIALSRLGELAECQLKRFKGVPQKVRIVSNNICYGPAPESDDEVEQHITINADERV